jgi:uncharacterized protein (DUF2344 family)
MNNKISIPEVHQGYMMQMRVKDSHEKIKLLNEEYFDNLDIDCKLDISSGFEIGCIYSIGLEFENYSFTIIDGDEEDIPEMIKKVEMYLTNKVLISQIIKFGKKYSTSNLGMKNLYRCLEGTIL